MHVHADRSMIDQILMNLAVNARDAMPQGGTVTVTTSIAECGRDGARRACIAVEDTGTGIAPDVLPHIFEPFFTTKDVGRGSGLGLATALSIAEQHQGSIEVQSEVGRGATFRTFLPTGTPDESLPNGSSLLLHKPVDATVLLRAVRECLDANSPTAAELA